MEDDSRSQVILLASQQESRSTFCEQLCNSPQIHIHPWPMCRWGMRKAADSSHINTHCSIFWPIFLLFEREELFLERSNLG